MKVYLNASLRGKKRYEKNFELLKKAIEAAGHEVVAAPVLEGDIDEKIEGELKKVTDYFKRRRGWLKKSDVCVFEVSFPSTGIGFEIALALQLSKPVVAFHVEDAPKNEVIETIKDEKFQVVEYQLDKLAKVVQSALDYASEQMDTRFNFFISPEIGSYLDWVSKMKKVPRAVYLRKLIEEDMKSESEFEG